MKNLKQLFKNLRSIEKTPQLEEEKAVISTDLTPKQRLDNVLLQVKALAQSNDYYTKECIFYIVKVYADKINRTDNSKLLETNGEYSSKTNRPLVFFSPKHNYKVKEPFRIYLGKSAVISDILKREKQINAFKSIGTPDNLFEERRNNNCYYFFMPVGLTYLYNGNHSSNSGIIKSQGYLEFIPGEINCHAYDLTPLYDEIYYDGECFRYFGNDEIFEKAMFEYGCIFEIGRILNEYKIDYFDYTD